MKAEYYIASMLALLIPSLLYVQYKDSYKALKRQTGATDRDIARWLFHKASGALKWMCVGLMAAFIIGLGFYGLWYIATGLSTITGIVIAIMWMQTSQQNRINELERKKDK